MSKDEAFKAAVAKGAFAGRHVPVGWRERADEARVWALDAGMVEIEPYRFVSPDRALLLEQRAAKK